MTKIKLKESDLNNMINESVKKVLLNEQVEQKLSTLSQIVNTYNKALQYLKKEQRYIKAANRYKLVLMINRNKVANVYNAIIYELNGVPEAKQISVLNELKINPVWVNNITNTKQFLYWLTKLRKGISGEAIRNANKIMRSETARTLNKELFVKNGKLIPGDSVQYIQKLIQPRENNIA